MSKAVLISIRPEWCEEIVFNNKTLEVRKTCPTLETPFKVYIYCTNVKRMNLQNYVAVHKATGGAVDDWSCKVIGEFICDKIEIVDIPYPAYQSELDHRFIEESRVSYYALHRYAFHDNLFFWHISDLKIYDQPLDLQNFTGLQKTRLGKRPVEITCPPQSWCYVEEIKQ